MPGRSPRNEAIDLVRGIAMVVMALDHARDFFGSFASRPTDLASTTAPLFLTRWITHFCAPVFVFLAGVSAYLYGSRGKSTRELASFLFTRGAWLVLLEFTVVRLAWTFDFGLHTLILQVIWAIGCSMIVLAGLVFLPRWAIVGIGAVLILLHNAFDTVDARGSVAWLWTVLHVPGRFGPWLGVRAFVLYPLVPWIGVMACGYALGPWARLPSNERRRRLLAVGTVLTIGFVALRATNVYGDPSPWHSQRSALFTVFSFINCEKYPPSLLYLLMTLGPALLAWYALERGTPRVLAPVLSYGRVPLFYYVLHLYAIHAAASLVAIARGGFAAWHVSHGRNLGLGLGYIYAAWVAITLALYPACAWFARVKASHRSRWLSYL